MFDYLLYGAYALFLWWFSTGLVLYLIGLASHTFRRSLVFATLALLLAFAGLAWSGGRETVFAAYLSFGCGLAVYAWLELTYYMGFVTGPRKIACPPNCGGWRHFGHAIEANLHHELATIAGAGIVWLICRDAPNQVGMWTYMALWGMQLSARLNVFLGVRNVSEEFLPEHMRYLKGFIKKGSLNLLFPFSIVMGTTLTAWLTQLALAAEAGSFAAAGWTMLATLVALAVLEHWLLVLPLAASAPWQWWLERREKAARNEAPAGLESMPAGLSGPVRASAVAVETGKGVNKSSRLPRGRENPLHRKL